MIRFNLKKIIVAAIVSMAGTIGVFADGNVGQFGSDPKISDLALIYAGNTHRPSWTKDDLTPYVTHRYADGSEDWFFDGFLFLEFSHGDVQFQNGSGLNPATQSDWTWLLDQFFAPDMKLDALDKLISDKKQTLGEPPLRPKVVISCCAPSKNKNGEWSRSIWGTAYGKSLRFISKNDRISAVKWYIDEILARWEAAGFKNIDLEGVYWIEEGLFSNGDIMAEINDYIHSKGLRSYWIPYYSNNQKYWSQWKDTYNFDMCYIQPNYAFLDNNGAEKPFSLLTETVDAAKNYGMGLELEFETQAKSNALHEVNPTLHQHINDYMDVFDEKGVFDKAGIAYYSGTQGFIHMDKSTDPVDHATIDRMARFVAARQKARRDNAAINDVTTDQVTIATTGDGCITLAADTCCHDISGRLLYTGAGSFACESGLYIVSDRRGNSMKLFVK